MVTATGFAESPRPRKSLTVGGRVVWSRPTMISFSADPNAAEQEMRAVIYYLTAFGFVHGTFDVSEMGFVLPFVRELSLIPI